MRNSPEDCYKAEIKNLYQRLKDIKNWKLIKDETNFQIFQSGEYFKTEAIVEYDADKLAVMASDISANTRLKWDPHINTTLTSLEEYKLDDGILNVVGFNGTVGIQWKRKLLIIYKTAEHRIHKATVHTKNEYIIWIKQLDKQKSFFTCIGMKPYVKIPYMLNAKYMDIYTPWICKICQKKVPPHELECRHCKTERYARCKDLKCYEAQREGNVNCQYCGIIL